MNDIYLGKILELEDYSSISKFTPNNKNVVDCEIIAYIKETKNFSSLGVSSISIAHALRYIELCNLYRGNEIKMEAMKYVVRLQNEEEEDSLDG